MTYPIITIDGPSGAGKGTIAYRLAKHFGFNLLDSGALYRIVGLLSFKHGLLTDKVFNHEFNHDEQRQFEQAVCQLTQNLTLDFVVNTSTEQVEILVNGVLLQDDIRNETVGKYASKVATLPSVRVALLKVQQDMALRSGLVADGRDMGTVVFPKADVKIFLTASSVARANRRVKQLDEAGKPADFEAILAQINARDEQDQNRTVAPLKPADDALVVDSSALTADEVFEQVVKFCQQQGVEA
ncbi:(d)CMP kinase [Moraxella sp.]|uniref:(d)CMP kinase n=1 Tax=Moraxella sp. TaxID=479 RepID=UPI0026DB2E0B|nr:(d)CMP kinase [Moraxella sp.]MDO4894489.1 (d)CMP kinase [Moraxella sp.]